MNKDFIYISGFVHRMHLYFKENRKCIYDEHTFTFSLFSIREVKCVHKEVKNLKKSIITIFNRSIVSEMQYI